MVVHLGVVLGTIITFGALGALLSARGTFRCHDKYHRVREMNVVDIIVCAIL